MLHLDNMANPAARQDCIVECGYMKPLLAEGISFKAAAYQLGNPNSFTACQHRAELIPVDASYSQFLFAYRSRMTDVSPGSHARNWAKDSISIVNCGCVSWTPFQVEATAAKLQCQLTPSLFGEDMPLPDA